MPPLSFFLVQTSVINVLFEVLGLSRQSGRLSLCMDSDVVLRRGAVPLLPLFYLFSFVKSGSHRGEEGKRVSSASSQSSVYTGRHQSAPCATRQVVNTRQSFFFTKQQQQQRAINTDYRSGGHKTSWTSAGGENTSSPNSEGADHKEKQKTEMIMERVTSKYNSEDVPHSSLRQKRQKQESE